MVCSQIGCGPALQALNESSFGEGSGPIWMDEIDCSESDTELQECRFRGWGSHNCFHHEDASVICERGM